MVAQIGGNFGKAARVTGGRSRKAVRKQHVPQGQYHGTFPVGQNSPVPLDGRYMMKPGMGVNIDNCPKVTNSGGCVCGG